MVEDQEDTVSLVSCGDEEAKDGHTQIRNQLTRIASIPAYGLLAASLTLNFLMLDILIFSKASTIKMFFLMSSPVYAWLSILMTLVLTGFSGLALSQLLFIYHRDRTWRGWGLMVLGAVFATLSIGCPDCGAPFLNFIGVPEGLSVFPLQGLELKLLSGMLLWFGLENNVSYSSQKSAVEAIDFEAEEPIKPRKNTWRNWRLAEALLMLGSILLFYLLPLLPAQAKIDFSNSIGSASVSTGNGAGTGNISEIVEQVVPSGGFTLGAEYGDLGPQLLEVGAIDYDLFVKIYEEAGSPLTEMQLTILREGSDTPIHVDRENSYFLLNFFWAFGLTNTNPILDQGPIMTYSEGEISRFASTGGWTIGQKPASQLFSSESIIQLTPDEQTLVENVALKVFRPCCNNPTIFPDCNHGMAMLGLLELLASQGVTEDEMLDAAKIVNAYWFPQQAVELATYFQAAEGLEFSQVEAEVAVGPEFFSGAGFRSVHDWLEANGLLETAPSQGGSCGV